MLLNKSGSKRLTPEGRASMVALTSNVFLFLSVCSFNLCSRCVDEKHWSSDVKSSQGRSDIATRSVLRVGVKIAVHRANHHRNEYISCAG